MSLPFEGIRKLKLYHPVKRIVYIWSSNDLLSITFIFKHGALVMIIEGSVHRDLYSFYISPVKGRLHIFLLYRSNRLFASGCWYTHCKKFDGYISSYSWFFPHNPAIAGFLTTRLRILLYLDIYPSKWILIHLYVDIYPLVNI